MLDPWMFRIGNLRIIVSIFPNVWGLEIAIWRFEFRILIGPFSISFEIL